MTLRQTKLKLSLLNRTNQTYLLNNCNVLSKLNSSEEEEREMLILDVI